MEFQISCSRKAGKNIPESSKSEFLRNLLAINFALPNAEDNNFGLFNKGGISDLTLLRTKLANC